MRGSHRQLVAALVVVALLFATTSYLSHGRDALAPKHDEARCVLCLQFHGTVGPPETASALSVPVQITRLGPLEPQALPVSGRKTGIRLPRAPPAIHVS